MVLNMIEFTGEYCLTKEQGNKLYSVVKSRVDQGVCITLNFQGVRLISDSYLYAGIGRLLERHNKETLNSLIKFIAIGKNITTISNVLRNSEKYYNNKQFRKNVEDIIGCDLKIDYQPKTKTKNIENEKECKDGATKIDIKTTDNTKEGIPVHCI